MRPDVLFFLLIIGFFFLIWVATGGPTRAISFAGPFITPITGEHQTQSGYGTTTIGRYTGNIQTGSRFQPSSFAGGDYDSSDSSDTATPANFGTPSPYKGMVTMSDQVNGLNTTNSSQENIEIYASADNTKSIDVSGWKLESTVTYNNGTIPVGTTLVHQGAGNILSDILLAPGDDAFVTSGVSPIGLSFKENECIGYFENTSKIIPAPQGSCPTAGSEFNTYYPGNPLADDACYAFVQKVTDCNVPSPIPSTLTSNCQNFAAEHLTYNGCVADHKTDADFYGKIWHIYLNQKGRLWKNSRENIKLLDASGKTVDMITY